MAGKTLFTLDTLGDLDDGTVRLLVDQAFSEALADCDNRPNLDKPRRVVMTLELSPVLHESGGMKGVQAEMAVKLSLPPRSTRGEYLPTTAMGDGIAAYLPSEHPVPLFADKKENAS